MMCMPDMSPPFSEGPIHWKKHNLPIQQQQKICGEGCFINDIYDEYGFGCEQKHTFTKKKQNMRIGEILQCSHTKKTETDGEVPNPKWRLYDKEH